MRSIRYNIAWLLISVAIILALLTGYRVYRMVMAPNVNINSKSTFFHVPSGTDFDQLISLLRTDSILTNVASFIRVSKWMKFSDTNVKPGRYRIDQGWSNRQLISVFRSGLQTPVNVVINSARTTKDLAGKVSGYLEPDSVDFLRTFEDSLFIGQLGYSPYTLMCAFIPNTYEMFWNTTPEGFLNRMVIEHDRFWTRNNRSEKANSLNLTKQQVYTLASIVDKETIISNEKPVVAGLYLNRIRLGMPLQADPTIVFAVGDFSLKRILNKHLEIDSPFNTYRYGGLPPGPICMPGIKSIDAVLNPTDHNYLYMCAQPGNNGLHAFASSLREHNLNAVKYRNWLNERGIR
jgi:UPF0755 protein